VREPFDPGVEVSDMLDHTVDDLFAIRVSLARIFLRFEKRLQVVREIGWRVDAPGKKILERGDAAGLLLLILKNVVSVQPSPTRHERTLRRG
jgi:hypothetical protein